MKTQKRFLMAICCCLVLQTHAQSPGSFDPLFANGGIGKYSVGPLQDNNSNGINSILPLADGSVILAGSSPDRMIVTRIKANGSIDATFGQGGLVYVKNGVTDYLTSAALQSDGKILLIGFSNNVDLHKDFSIIRLTADGKLDSSFDGEGKLLISIGSGDDAANSVTLQGDGKILVAGYSSNGSNNDFSVIRLHADGKLDKTFNGDGKLLIPVGSGDDVANAIALQSDGKILVAGNSTNGSDYADFSVIRLNAKGNPDSSFNGNGKLLIPVGDGSDYATSIALRPNRKIVLAGYSSKGHKCDFSVVQLRPNGSLDTSFKDGGKFLISVAGDDRAYAAALQSDGKILLAGTSKDGLYHYSVIRLNIKGTLDRSFNGTGKYLSPAANNDYARSIALKSDGKILLAGTSYNSSSHTDFSVMRLNNDGSPDNSFGTAGKLLIATQSSDDIATSMALQTDGKILLAGYSYIYGKTYFSVARLSADGKPDSSFDGDGRLLISLGSYNDCAQAIAVQSDGKILLAGYSYVNSYYSDFAVVRLNNDGSFDNNFDGDGKLVVPIGAWNDMVQAIALQSDGKILLAGYTDKGDYYNNYDFAVVRLNSNGSLDYSFDTDGKLTIAIGSSDDRAQAIALQSDGKILLAGGGLYYYNDPDFSIVRLNTNGSLDSSFDEDGKALIQMGSYADQAQAIAVQSDGKILAAGYSSNGNNYDFAVARINSDGSPDKTFSKSGKLIISFGSSTAIIRSIALQNDGKIILTGSSNSFYFSDFAMVRLDAKGSLNANFGEGGKEIISTPFYKEAAVASVLQPDGKLIVAGYGDADLPGDKFIAMRFFCANNTNPFAKTSAEESKATKNNFTINTTKLVIPTMLHPNETWRIQRLPDHNSIVLADMNGRILLRQTNYQNDKAFTGWPQGMYYYRINFINKEGKPEVFKGKLVLVP